MNYEPFDSPEIAELIQKLQAAKFVELAQPIKNDRQDFFRIRTANQCLEEARKKPISKMLFSEFWFENELCILFADTNLGKSILAVQIAESISRGTSILGFKFEAAQQKVLYFDFELSEKQFEARYSNDFADHYMFDDNFFRVEINPDAPLPSNVDFESFLLNSLEKAIIHEDAKVLIIDNITYLKNETERAKDALPLMKLLKSLKSKHDLSILALAHTPKRDLTKGITRNDLSGSKMLINFVDSAFAIGESNSDKNIRYLKQIKERATEKIYDSENVCVCQVIKKSNFLQFEFLRFGIENEHLKQHTSKDKEKYKEQVIVLHQEGKSLREIAQVLNTSHMRVKRILDGCSTM